MLNGSVVITAKEGSLNVDARGATKNVAKGQTIVITPKTADKKKGGGAGWGGGNTSEYFDIAILAAAGTGAILAGVALSRAGNANTNAIAATSAADAATSAANAATSAATAAGSTATAAASSAAAAQLLAECAYDLEDTKTYASPYVLSPAACATAGGNAGAVAGSGK